MKRLIAIFIVMVLAVLTMASAAFAEDGLDTVTIYHTNDVHGYVESSYDKEGNLTKLGMEHVAALKKAHPDAILVDAGDYSQGSLFSNLAHGASSFDVMNHAGYDIAAIGNHEFDWGVDEFEENAKIREFQIICANISIKDDMKDVSPYLASMPPYVVKEVKGHKIAFFALDTAELYGMVKPATLKAGGIEVREDLVNVATEMVAKIREEVPDVGAIVCLTHCGYIPDGANETSYHVAGVEGIDIVIDAHDHETRLGDTAKKVGDTMVVSTGTQLQHIGAVTLSFDGDKLVTIQSYDAGPEAMTLEGDPDTLRAIADWNKIFADLKAEVAFKSEVNFWGGNLKGRDASDNDVTASIARRGYTNAGQLISDARMWQAKEWLAENYEAFELDPATPIVGIFGGGSVRGSFKAGDVTLGDLMSCYSFSFEDAQNSYVLITPKVLYDTIEHGVNIFLSQDPETGMLTADGSTHGRFPQIAGASYVFDITQPASHEYDKDNMKMPDFIGSRVQSITLDDGTVLDRNDNETPIILITGSYEIGGGDSYWMLGVLNDAEDYGGYQYIPLLATPDGNSGDILIDYIKTQLGGVVKAESYPLTSDRIKRVNDVYTGESYEAVLTVTTDGETPLADTAVKVYVDGKLTEMTTDADGKLTIEGLTNGAHEVRVIGEGYDSGTVYLDNYVGLVHPILSHTPGEIEIGGEVAPVEPAKTTSPVLWIVLAVAAVAVIAYLMSRKKKTE